MHPVFWLSGGTVYTGDLKSDACKGLRVRIPPQLPTLGPIAQLAEHRTFNPQVPGSIPGGPTIFTTGDKMRNVIMLSAAMLMACGDKEDDSASDSATAEDTAVAE